LGKRTAALLLTSYNIRMFARRFIFKSVACFFLMCESELCINILFALRDHTT